MKISIIAITRYLCMGKHDKFRQNDLKEMGDIQADHIAAK